MSSEDDRARALNAAFHDGETPGLHILKTDMGAWPPAGLCIVQPPAGKVRFERYFKPFSDTSAYVDFASVAGIIFINTAHYLTAQFNNASRSLADTVAHESFHVFQKNRMRNGISNAMGRNRDYELNQYLRKNANGMARYLCHKDETQVRLHQIIAQHHRRFHKLPLNTHELYALLQIERVTMDAPWVNEMLSTPQGIAAKNKFDAPSAPLKWSRPAHVQDMEQIFASIAQEKRNDYYQNILPALYGQILEIYGDQEGSRRVGHTHNITMTEFFFRQAWNLQHRWKEGQKADMGMIDQTIHLMPPSQAADLMDHLHADRPYTHPFLKRDLSLDHDTARKIIPSLAARTEIGATLPRL